jgi:hypothetical protein
MSVQEPGVYWPFKSFLSGSGIVLTETATGITIATTGAGPGGGDMLSSVYATNGQPGVVDKALSLVGTVAHATLADQVPWTGITGAPTLFPTDWGSVQNKPSSFVPIAHASTHITGGSDVIALATTTAAGLTGALSGKVTDYKAGDGTWQNLSTAVGSNPLTVTSPATYSGGLTVQGNNLVINNAAWLVNDPAGTWCGIYNTGANDAVIALANGGSVTNDSFLIYHEPANLDLRAGYYNTSGTSVYVGSFVNTYNPTGAYSFRASTRLIGSGSLPGDNTAWQLAPFLANSSAAGGFIGYGMVSNNYWGCC